MGRGKASAGQVPARARHDVLVLCAYEFQPHDRLFPGVEVVRCPIDDHPPTKDERRLVRTVSILVSRFVKRGDHTLVTCQMGLNRSAFVAALAMIRLGCLPAEAIDRIRSVRGKDALFNESFERYILRFRLGR